MATLREAFGSDDVAILVTRPGTTQHLITLRYHLLPIIGYFLITMFFVSMLATVPHPPPINKSPFGAIFRVVTPPPIRS